MIERIFFEYNGFKCPLIKIEEENEIGIYFTQFDGEHITLHRTHENQIQKTHWGQNKPKSTWDELRLEAAKSKVKNWQRHDKYYDHSFLQRISNIDGYYLVGRLLEVGSPQIEIKSKYFKKANQIIHVDQKKFFLNIYLSTLDNTYTKNNPFVKTRLGKLFFEIEGQTPIA